jgi:hypothetical protein
MRKAIPRSMTTQRYIINIAYPKKKMELPFSKISGRGFAQHGSGSVGDNLLKAKFLRQQFGIKRSCLRNALFTAGFTHTLAPTANPWRVIPAIPVSRSGLQPVRRKSIPSPVA